MDFERLIATLNDYIIVIAIRNVINCAALHWHENPVSEIMKKISAISYFSLVIKKKLTCWIGQNLDQSSQTKIMVAAKLVPRDALRYQCEREEIELRYWITKDLEVR